jgi:hypothetical protein
MYVRQAFYHWATPQPFFILFYFILKFWDGLLKLHRLASNFWSSCFNFPRIWDYRYAPLCLTSHTFCNLEFSWSDVAPELWSMFQFFPYNQGQCEVQEIISSEQKNYGHKKVREDKEERCHKGHKFTKGLTQSPIFFRQRWPYKTNYHFQIIS